MLSPTFPFKYPMLFLLAFCIFAPYLAQSQSYDFVETREAQIFPVTTNSPHFSIDLDYPEAFEVTIKSFNNNESQTGFCETTPSRISSKIEWSGPINMTDDSPDATGLSESRSYDNVVFFKDYYFILDSLSFDITAIKDYTNRASYIRIPSEFKNEDEDQQLEDTYLIVDTDDQILFIITRKNLLYYPLTPFFEAIKNKKEVPKIKSQAVNFPGFDMILSIRYHKHRLYIVGDNVVQVFVVSTSGEITPQIKFDSAFFDAGEVSISDIAFRGNYAFMLDKLKGVYVVDISKADQVDNSNLTQKYVFNPQDTKEVQKGQFVEIVGDSLHVISSGAKNPFIFEYIIKGDPVFLSLEFNRKIELFQSIKDSYSDSNFLFLLTGFFNMATKHSIPGRYHSSNVQEYLTDYWPLLGAKAIVSWTKNSTSIIAALHEDRMSIIRFEESNPYISCNTAGVAEGYYAYSLHAVQKTCSTKQKNNITDYNTICEINQDLQILMVKDTVEVGNVVEARKTVNYLFIGLGVMGLLLIIFLCLFRKYKNQYQRLESRFKFQKLEEDNTENVEGKDTGKRKADSDRDINPYSINIQAELKKDEERSKNKSPIKNKEVQQEKPNAEFGDLKPLDIEEIYGRKGNAAASGDSF